MRQKNNYEKGQAAFMVNKPKTILSILLIISLVFGLFVPLSTAKSHADAKDTNAALEKQGNIDLVAGDQVSKETLKKLEENRGVVLFESSDLAQTAALDDDEMKVKLTYDHVIRYDNYLTRNYRCEFKGKKKVAYCIQPKETPPDPGSYVATEYNNKTMVRALYYMYGYPGYAKKVQSFVSSKDKDDDWSDDEGAYALCHMVLSYLYDKESVNSDAFLGVSSDTKKLVVKVADYVAALPDAPTDTSISVSKSSVKAVWDWTNNNQKTPSITLNTHEDNRINVVVPAKCTLHRISNGETKAFGAEKTVKIYGGDSFYFTAEKSVSGIYNSGKLEGSLASFSPYLISITGKQNIFFCGQGDTDSVSFSVDWIGWGQFQGKKFCDDGEKTNDNIKNVYKNLQFQIDGNGMPTPIIVKVNDKGELTSKDGSTKFELLEGGSYTITETFKDDRYKTMASATFNIEANETYTLPSRALSNITKKGKMQITKLWIDPDTGIESSVIQREEGIVFRVWDTEYADAGWKFEDVPAIFKDEITTNKEGIALSKELPIGKYLVQQITKDKTNWAIKDFHFDISAKANGEPEVKNLDIVNKPVLNRFRIEKIDAETKQPIKQGGIKFKVRDKDGNIITQLNDKHETIDTFVTDDDGIARSPETIKAGKYEVYEVTAPNGYVREIEPVAFEVTSDTEVDEIVKVPFKNMPQKGLLHIHKFRQIMQKNNSGQELTQIPLPFVKFKIQAAEDIRTGDNTLRYKKGQTADCIMTDEDGNATTDQLYLGTYNVVEEGIYNKVRTYNLSPDNVDTIIENWVNTVLVNGGQPPTQEEKDTFKSAIGLKLTAKYIVEENDRYFQSPRGNKDYAYTPAQLEAMKVFAESLPKEQIKDSFISTDTSIYNIPEDGVMKTIKLEYAGQDISVIEKDIAIINELGTGDVEINKTDITDAKPLPNAVIEIYDENKNLVYSGITDQNGQITFKQLPIGSYFFRETVAPDGYILDPGWHSFEIKANGEIVKCNITNKPEQGSVEITKTDITNAKPLPGAKIEIYDKDKNPIQSAVTDKNGMVRFQQLRVGQYYFKETAAPDGYILDSKIYPFEIKENNQVVKCNITNTPKPATLEILKISKETQKTLKDATFALYDSKKQLIEKKTSGDNGKINFQDLKPGSYYYKEIKAPKGYELDSDWKKIKIKKYGEKISIKVENEKIIHPAHAEQKNNDYPQTGDDFPFFLVVIIAICAGIIAVMTYRRRKLAKKDE